MDDFDAEIAENLAVVEAVLEMRPAVRADRTYIEAVNDMFLRLAIEAAEEARDDMA